MPHACPLPPAPRPLSLPPARVLPLAPRLTPARAYCPPCSCSCSCPAHAPLSRAAAAPVAHPPLPCAYSYPWPAHATCCLLPAAYPLPLPLAPGSRCPCLDVTSEPKAWEGGKT
jgi:hypothetical protein